MPSAGVLVGVSPANGPREGVVSPVSRLSERASEQRRLIGGLPRATRPRRTSHRGLTDDRDANRRFRPDPPAAKWAPALPVRKANAAFAL